MRSQAARKSSLNSFAILSEFAPLPPAGDVARLLPIIHQAALEARRGGLDIQMLVGLILYFFLSPLTTAAFKNFGAAMSNPILRFFAIEHILYMIVAVALGHVGRTLAKKATEAVAKHRISAILYGLAVVVILLAIPWSRPLFRL